MNERTATRRGFLTGAVGMAGLAMVVAACGGQSTTPSQLASTAAPAGATTAPAANHGGTTPAPVASQAAGQPTAANAPTVLLNGAGSTFDYPLFSKAFSEYTNAHPNVKVNYQSVGSGAGIQQLTKGTVDFGASDAPMTDQQMRDAGGDVIHLPITLGAVSVAYNLPGIPEGVQMDGSTLADIYLGTITSWNDAALVKLNPSAKLPNLPIAVVHRSDGSGTTDIFTTYLTTVSSTWKQKIGNGTAVNWPVGIGGKGSEGVSGQVKQTPGGIGYFELAYAKQNSLTSAAINNGAGKYLLPSSDGASACAAGAAANLPADLRVRIAGCAGDAAYPISGFSWVLLHQKQTDPAKGEALANLMWWMIHDGQNYSTNLFYAPLPAPVVKLDEEKLRSVSYQGKPLLVGASSAEISNTSQFDRLA
ncbi:MAG: phosphate ABC transporter substrate-binding protein PstS [Candidatus Dormibacteraceae bacterium]